MTSVHIEVCGPRAKLKGTDQQSTQQLPRGSMVASLSKLKQELWNRTHKHMHGDGPNGNIES